MASSTLERSRLALEEIEVLEHAISDALDNKGKAHKAAALTDLQVAAYMHQAQRAAASVAASWEDKEGARVAELQAMVGIGAGAAAGAGEGGSADILACFYQRLGEVREQHAATRGQAAPPISSSTVTAASDASASSALSSFSPEELYGRYVDLAGGQGLWEEFTNLPAVKEGRIAVASDGRAGVPDDLQDVLEQSCADYASYLAKMTELHASLPARVKTSRAYRRYIPGLARYLLHFLARRAPLINLPGLLEEWAREFTTAWEAGQVQGWAQQQPAAAGASDPSTALTLAPALADLAAFASVEELLEQLGPEGCKAQLQVRGLKAGGTPAERAARLWSVRGLAPQDYPKKLRAPPGGGGGGAAGGGAAEGQTAGGAGAGAGAGAAAVKSSSSSSEAAGAGASSSASDPSSLAVPFVDPAAWGAARFGGPPSQSLQTAAWTEAVALNCARLLGDVLADTRRRIQRRATRTYAELQTDREAEEAEVSGEGGAAVAAALEDDDEEGGAAPIYNPLNIPLGWDGKPIPYWLYRLHGLNIEYPCEICGGAVYRGRRDFDRHFQEWRHAAGMRALGIPNTKHFHDITKIGDAQALYARIKASVDKEGGGKGPAAEEYEDSSGTVLDAKTYQDLARQGLL